eukprot:SAG11_NODE_1179_length_5597_cov_3.257184_2_plen_591_part_00
MQVSNCHKATALTNAPSEKNFSALSRLPHVSLAFDSPMTVVVFTVPPGVRAGQQIVVQAPNGQRVTVQLPANTRPGQRMQVNVPEPQPPPSSIPPPLPTPPAGGQPPIAPGGSGAPAVPPAPSSQGASLYEFVVPPGAKAFQRLMVQVPSGQRVNVQLPAGAAPGMRMRVAVPTANSDAANLPPVEAVAKQLGERAGRFTQNLNQLRGVLDRHKQGHRPPQPSHLVLNVRRERILEDALWYFLKEPMSDPAQLRSKPFQIKFVGEEGIDQGGLTREFYTALTHAFVDPSPALFTHSADSDYTYQINPLSGINPEHLQYFELLGKVIAKSIFDGVQLDVHFSPAFYKVLLNLPLGFADLESVDMELHKSLQYLHDNLIDDQCLCLYFTASYDEFGVAHEDELKPGGAEIEVTDANKDEFIDLKTKWRLERRVEQQMEAVRRGFYQIMPEREISPIGFDDRELELIMCGIPKIDIADWRANCEYKSGFKNSDKVVQMFWKVIDEWDDELRCAVLRFVTGTPKVPVEGFAALKGTGGAVKKFCIQKVQWDVERLPQAATCFNTLYLPPYKTEDQLKDKLEFAITEASAGFGLK